MRILIACEWSGTVRDAFIAHGHDAWSCDIEQSDSPGPHYQCNVTDLLADRWDMLIAFPPCTYLCNSGVRWLCTSDKTRNINRWQKMRDAAEFFRLLLNAPIDRICVENPVMHGHTKLPKFTQSIQPWQYGHGETKRTCLWLKNLPPLIPTDIVSGREARIHKMPPSKDRAKLRGKTYQGVADAMADQWGVPA